MNAVPARYSATPPPSANAPNSSSACRSSMECIACSIPSAASTTPATSGEMQVGVRVGRRSRRVRLPAAARSACSALGAKWWKYTHHSPTASATASTEPMMIEVLTGSCATPMPIATTDSPSARITTRPCRSEKCVERVEPPVAAARGQVDDGRGRARSRPARSRPGTGAPTSAPMTSSADGGTSAALMLRMTCRRSPASDPAAMTYATACTTRTGDVGRRRTPSARTGRRRDRRTPRGSPARPGTSARSPA